MYLALNEEKQTQEFTQKKIIRKIRVRNRALLFRQLMSDRTASVQQPIRYTPDFVCKDHRWIIETKGYLPSHHDFPMRWKLFLNYIMKNNLGYDVYLAKNKQQVDQAVIEILKSKNNESEWIKRSVL